MTVFIRLLASPISNKGDDLRQRIESLNGKQVREDTFLVSSMAFSSIPGTPFAYWVDENTRQIFKAFPAFESNSRYIKSGLKTADDSRFIRLWWEIAPKLINRFELIKPNGQDGWVPFAKGGNYLLFYSDLHLVVNWGKRPAIANTPWSDLGREEYYGRPGLTYPTRTTSGFSPRVLPAGSIFGHKGSSIFFPGDDSTNLLSGLAICSSECFELFIKLGLGAADMAARSYEVGLIQKMPWAEFTKTQSRLLSDLAEQSFRLTRQPFIGDETTHIFGLPSLLNYCHNSSESILTCIRLAENFEIERHTKLVNVKSEIDSYVAGLYGISKPANSYSDELRQNVIEDDLQSKDDDENEETTFTLNPPSLVSDLLMWCVGVSVGRWDVRFALDPSSLPPLPGPFDPLPVCSPGMLTGSDGFPLTSSPENYPLPVAWDGFLVDDPGHPGDIVLAVQRVLRLLWPETAESIETEACQILSVPDLRAWFRDPKGFFAYHIKRYSKSRRKAPIYWLLQSAKRNYGIWLYYPRLNPDSLFRAGREYADAKLSLETGRLKDYHTGLSTAIGSARKVQERKMATQEALVAELKSFQKALDAAAMLELKPDLNDGVLLNIAPLYELVPWKEAERAWQELLRGKYEWSSISQWLRQKGLVKN